MDTDDAVVAVFADRQAAETAVNELSAAGFEMQNLSVVGKRFHTEVNVVRFDDIGYQIKLWGSGGVFWGGLWGLFSGGLFLTIPGVGQVVVVGYLGAIAISAIESALVVGGGRALGAALYGIGVPKDGIVEYETVIKAHGFLVVAHGSATEVARAETILHTVSPSRLAVHVGVSAAPADRMAAAAD